MALVNAANRVPEHQRNYQHQYKQHVRLWKMGPRANLMMIPYQILLWGSFGSSMYMMSRKIAGYNTWFGKN
ncbi:Cytochrome c oxidase subunit VII [Microdochium nivale]|nr:Cytochrome c oxidase subunit VII [Microdochium nivale]